jgi:flagella basal body P-ring formation protein FlgA
MALPIALSAAPVTVEILPRATVEGAHIRLGDIARIDADAETAGALAGVTVARSPRAGLELVLTAQEIKRNVRMAVTRRADEVQWRGDSARVERASVLLEGERVQRTAAEYLKAHLSARAQDVQVIPVMASSDLRIPRGALVLEARGGPERGVGSKRQSIWVDVMVDGVREHSVNVGLEVRAMQNVLYLRRDRRAGEVLQAGDFEAQLTDATLVGGAAALDQGSFEGLRLKRAATAGQPLRLSDLEMRPAVARGEIVTLTASTATVSVEARVVALDDGNRGDHVWVRQGQNGEAVRTRVVAAGVVELGER